MGLLTDLARGLGRLAARILAPDPAPAPGRREPAPPKEPARRRQRAAPATSTAEPSAPSRQRAAKTTASRAEPAVQPTQTRPAVSVPLRAERAVEEAPARPEPAEMPELETEDEAEEYGENLWDQLNRLSDDTLITLQVLFADVEDPEGNDYESP